VTAARGKWSVGTALSLITATFNTGMVLGPITGGWIGERYGLRGAHFVAAGIFVASTFFIFFIQKQPIDHHDPESPPMDLNKNMRFVSYLGIVAFAIFAMYLAQPLTPIFLEDVRGLSLSDLGTVFTIGALGNALIAILLGRTNPYWGYILSQLMVAAFSFCMLWGTTLPIIALGYFLLGGFRAGRPMVMAQARELIHESQMGISYGVMETISAVIFIVTPPLAGYLFEIDPFIVYPISIVLITISIVISYFFSPRKIEEQVTITS